MGGGESAEEAVGPLSRALSLPLSPSLSLSLPLSVRIYISPPLYVWTEEVCGGEGAEEAGGAARVERAGRRRERVRAHLHVRCQVRTRGGEGVRDI